MKREITVMALSAALLAAGMLWLSGPLQLAALLAAYLLSGGPTLLAAGRNIRYGQIFDENLLMSVSSLGALAIGHYEEAVGVMLFFRLGELCEQRAVNRSRRSIAALMDIRPDTVHLLRDNQELTLPTEAAQVGESIRIHPGERVPLDCRVLAGSSALDTSALTGEAAPRACGPGDELLSGCVNLTGLLTACVLRPDAESTVSRILELVENSAAAKGRAERFITRFARVYTPAVMAAAALLALVPPLLLGQDFAAWCYRAMVLLVVSCPCALVISVPLSFFGGIGGASRQGVLIKGGGDLENLAHAEIVALDKTGTLTRGQFAVQQVDGVDMEPGEVLRWAAAAEQYSSHPLALAIRAAAEAESKNPNPAGAGAAGPAAAVEVTEEAGLGVCAQVAGRQVLVGSSRLLAKHQVEIAPALAAAGVLVAVDGRCVGSLRVGDSLRPDAAAAIAGLRQAGVKKIVLLSGDNQAAAEAVGQELGLDQVQAGLLPADKVRAVEALLDECSPRGQLVFVGDGLNDAPVLARADVGVAMGGLGAEAAIEAADVVIMTDQPAKLVTGIRVARRALAIARQNIIFALSVKLVVLALGAVGLASMWAAVFADVGVAILAILNASRAVRG